MKNFLLFPLIRFVTVTGLFHFRDVFTRRMKYDNNVFISVPSSKMARDAIHMDAQRTVNLTKNGSASASLAILCRNNDESPAASRLKINF